MSEFCDPQTMGQLHEMVGQALAGEGISFGPESEALVQGPNAGMCQIQLDAGDWVRIAGSRLSGQQFLLKSTALEGGQHLLEATVDLGSVESRNSFIGMTLDALGYPDELKAEIRGALDAALEQVVAAAGADAPASDGDDDVPEFFVMEDQPNLQRNGIYRHTSGGPVQITNFVMRIEEHICLHGEEGAVETRFRGRIVCLGRTRDFEMSAEEFAGNERLKAVIFRSAPPGADIRSKPDVVRRAITGVSSPAIRDNTEDAGWAEDGTRFLLPNGHVDASGFHDSDADAGVPKVVFKDDQSKCWLGMRRLAPEELLQVRRHVVEDLLNLHDRRVMRCLLSAAALAPLLASAPTKSRPLIWLKGSSGLGKTYAASLSMNFFGDYDVSAGYRIVTWNATGNYLQKLGFLHKDCLFLIDDFKPELASHRDALRLLQNYADGTGRGRLNADSSMKVVRPIRGLLLSTGEDFPMHSASGLARAVVVQVPNRPKDIALARRCRDQGPLYRGMMADFIARLIRDQRKPVFAERVEHWSQFYYDEIAGRQNDARIAGNHALLAAAFEEFARYLGDVWVDWESEAREFARTDLLEMVSATVGAAEREQESSIFVETLGSLIECERVWIKGLNFLDKDRQRTNLLIGGVLDPSSHGANPQRRHDLVLGINIPNARQAVQKSLREQRKPELALADQSLIQQLAAAGLLLDKNNEPIPADHSGVKTHQVWIEGSRMRVARIRYAALQHPEGIVSQAAPDQPPTFRLSTA